MITEFKEVEKALRSKGYYYDTHNGRRTKVELGKDRVGFARVYNEELGWFLTPVFEVPQSINPLFIGKDGEVLLSVYSVGGILMDGYESIDEYNDFHRPNNPHLAMFQQIQSVELYDKLGNNTTSLEYHNVEVPSL